MDVLGSLVDLVQQGDQEPAGLARPVFGAGNDALARSDERYGLLLYGRGHEVAGLGQRQYDVLLEFQLVEVLVLGGFDVLRGRWTTLVWSRRS